MPRNTDRTTKDDIKVKTQEVIARIASELNSNQDKVALKLAVKLVEGSKLSTLSKALDSIVREEMLAAS